jgi:hypothetical protein
MHCTGVRTVCKSIKDFSISSPRFHSRSARRQSKHNSAICGQCQASPHRCNPPNAHARTAWTDVTLHESGLSINALAWETRERSNEEGQVKKSAYSSCPVACFHFPPSLRPSRFVERFSSNSVLRSACHSSSSPSIGRSHETRVL